VWNCFLETLESHTQLQCPPDPSLYAPAMLVENVDAPHPTRKSVNVLHWNEFFTALEPKWTYDRFDFLSNLSEPPNARHQRRRGLPSGIEELHRYRASTR
jgi:hypothetical protein